MKCRPKLLLEAVRWDGNNVSEVTEMGSAISDVVRHDDNTLQVQTELGGRVDIAQPGDYVLRSIVGDVLRSTQRSI